METQVADKQAKLRWCYRAIITDSMFVTFAAIGLGVVILSFMGRDGTLLFQENGPIELIQSTILFATAICGGLGYIYGDERIGSLCGIIALISATFLLREIPRCESINSALCINANIKRPAAVLTGLGAFMLSSIFAWREKDIILKLINPRFAWPFYFSLIALVVGQLFEKLGFGAAEEVLELYGYAILLQAATFLASAFLPRLNFVLSAYRAIPLKNTKYSSTNLK